MRPPIDSSCQQIGFLVGSLHHTIRTRINNQLRAEDLTKTQFDVLVFLEKNKQQNKEVIQKDLEAHFQVSNPTVSSLLDRLEGKGLIQRVVFKKDRRIRHLQITELGHQQVERVKDILENAETSMLNGMSEEEIETGKQFLQRTLRNITGKEVIDSAVDSSKTD